jgi:hypothetical protein
MSAQSWSLESPAGELRQAAVAAAERSSGFAGRTIGLFWNGKPGGDVFLEEVGRELSQRFQGAKVLKIWEARPDTVTSYGNSAANLEYMARSADLVIAASSD